MADAQANSLSALEQYLSDCGSLIDSTLDALLPAEQLKPIRIHQAIRWSVFAGGKRFRPALVLASGETFGARRESLIKTACAFEMVHTYSLIHDDLPAMDDDDLRRGRPTCHVKFDEATAILAGDALQAFAFKTIAEDEQLDHAVRVRVLQELAVAAGTPEGMVAGQAMDIESESIEVSGRDLEQIHLRKTGALISAAARSGLIIAGVGHDSLEAITQYASNLGLLFQITDDLLDITATAKELGKTPGKDARSAKATYPGLYGLGITRDTALRVHEQACASLTAVEGAALLKAIADYILTRTA